MQKRFRREIASLEEIFAFLRSFFEGANLDRKHLDGLSLAAEELFTNMVKYNPEKADDISIEVDITGDQVCLTLTDPDADFFDVTRPRPAPREVPLQDLDAGGFGLRLVHQMMDGISYQYDERRSTITVTKRLR